MTRGRPSREALLRPEFAADYPGLQPGQWNPAAVLADRVLAGALLRGSSVVIFGRLLPDHHFAFRGGSSEGGQRELLRGA